MYTEEQFEQLESEERQLTEEAILTMFLILGVAKSTLEKELRDFYSKYGRDGVVTYAEARKWISEQNHQRRLTALLLVITGAFAVALEDLEIEFRRFLIEVVAKETTFFGVPVDVDKLLNRKWDYNDLYWLERLKGDVELWQNYIASDLKRALHRGDNLDGVLKQLDKRFNSMNSVLESLGLSESTALGSMAREQIFRELGVTKYQFFSRVDERRCEVCGSLHGQIFPISAYEVGVTASPVHRRCRCWEVPITD